MVRLRCSLVWLLILGLLTVGEALATSTRIQSLGGEGDYFEDDFNVLRWYGSLPGYGDQAVLELGDILLNGSAANEVFHQGAGAHVELGAEGMFGSGALYVSDVTDPFQVPGTLSLLWARAWGAIQPGIAFQWSRVEDTQGEAESFLARKGTNTTLGLALRWDLATRAYLDLGADLIGTRRRITGQADADHSFTQEQELVWQSYSLRGRAFWGVADAVALVPLIDHERQEHLTVPWQLVHLPANRDMYLTRLGLGVNVFPDGDNLLVFSYEYSTTTQNLAFQPNPLGLAHWEGRTQNHRLRLGFESRVTSWLTLRGGARQDIPNLDVTVTVTDGEQNEALVVTAADPDLDLNLGCGLHFGAFDADLVFNEKAPFALGQFLIGTGGERNNNFTSITLKYGF